MSAHTATHVDAPYHVQSEGQTIEEMPMSPFVGSARVVDVQGESTIRPEHVANLTEQRLLFKTAASALPDDEWPETVTEFDPAAVRLASQGGASLLGTDAPSVDPLDSTDLPAHHTMIDSGIVPLEGLRLRDVDPGRYHLMALPLKVENGDAAPVRAVLSDGGPTEF